MLSCAKVHYLKETILGDAKEKANLLNCFFATAGMKLADTIKRQHQALATTSKPVPYMMQEHHTVKSRKNLLL